MATTNADVLRVFDTPGNLSSDLKDGMFGYDTTNDRIAVKRLADSQMLYVSEDSQQCLLAGNQTVAGIKTFSSFPVTPSSAPTTDYQTANKKYVDDSVSAEDFWDRAGTVISTRTAEDSLVLGATTTVALLDLTREGASGKAEFILENNWTANNNIAVKFKKSRGNSKASPTALATGDFIGDIRALGHDGSDYIDSAAIQFISEGTISTGVVPTIINFKTMDLAGSFADRFTIQDGNVGIGVVDPDALLEVAGTTHIQGATTLDSTLDVTSTVGINAAGIHEGLGLTVDNAGAGIAVGDELLSFKDSVNLSHGVTDLAETNTWLAIRELADDDAGDPSGGAHFLCLAEGDLSVACKFTLLCDDDEESPQQHMIFNCVRSDGTGVKNTGGYLLELHNNDTEQFQVLYNGDLTLGNTANAGTLDMYLKSDGKTGLFRFDGGNDWFYFDDDILITSAEKIMLRDTAIGIYSQANTFADHFADGGMRFGDSSAGAPTNYSMFGPDGRLTMVGDARARFEERINVTGVGSGAAAPTAGYRDIGASGDVKKAVLKFSKTQQNDIYFEFHSSCDADFTEDVELHLMWIPGAAWTSGNYVWKVEYLVKDENESVATGTPTTISEDVTPSNATDLIETEFSSTISMAGEQILIGHLYRDVASDNGDDVGEFNFIEKSYLRGSLGEAL